jgi:hypothetical protein
VALLLACACGDGRRDEPIGGGSGSSAIVVTPAVIAPHETAIDLIAVTSAGDAALTADTRDGIRLWPTLDGTREPVVVRLAAPRELALGRDAHGFIAASLDDAGGIALARLDREGRLRDRTLVTAEAGYAQIVAFREHVIARRRDHVIVQLAGDGRVIATLAAAPGEQLATILTRGEHLMAAILGPPPAGDDDVVQPIVGLRRIAPVQLAWGDRILVRARADDDLAISPNGHRLVVFRDDTVLFFDLVTGKQRPETLVPRVPGGRPENTAGGFLDDDHVVLFGAKVVHWDKLAVADPSLNTTATVIKTPTVLAIGGGIIVGRNGTGLQLGRADGTSRWLGYTAIGPVRALHSNGSTIQIELEHDLLWLDRRLSSTRTLSSDSETGDDQSFAFGDNHVLESSDPGAGVKIRDLVTNSIIDLGSGFDQITSVAYDPVSSVLAIVTPSRTHQIQVDLKRGTTETLPVLATPADARVELVDRTTGIAAVAISPNELTGEAMISEGEVVTTFPVEGTSPIKPTSRIKVSGRVMGVDRNGTVWAIGDALTMFRAGKQVARLPRPLPAFVGAVSRDGSHAVLFDDRFAVGLDGAGKERWRVPLWNTMEARFTADGSALAAGTAGGVVLLDPQTGARRAIGCGWGFGLHREQPTETAFDVPVVCADDAAEARP